MENVAVSKNANVTTFVEKKYIASLYAFGVKLCRVILKKMNT